MEAKKSGFEEVESILRDIGTKIEELIEKGTQAGGEAKVEIDRSTGKVDVHSNKTREDIAHAIAGEGYQIA